MVLVVPCSKWMPSLCSLAMQWQPERVPGMVVLGCQPTIPINGLEAFCLGLSHFWKGKNEGKLCNVTEKKHIPLQREIYLHHFAPARQRWPLFLGLCQRYNSAITVQTLTIYIFMCIYKYLCIHIFICKQWTISFKVEKFSLRRSVWWNFEFDHIVGYWKFLQKLNKLLPQIVVTKLKLMGLAVSC